MSVLTDRIKDKIVKFSRYSCGVLYYTCEDGFEFPVPIEDTSTSTFLAEDKAIYFMRWMKKYIESVKNEEVKTSTPVSKLTPQEKSKGRSESYWDMSSEDKRLGILDWDGK